MIHNLMKTKQSDDRNGIQRENYPMSDYDEEINAKNKNYGSLF